MDPDYVLKWMVGVSSLFALVSRLRQPRNDDRGWRALLAILLALVLGAAAFGLPAAGYVLGSLWLLLVAVPMWAIGRQLVCLKRDDLNGAARWARVVATLHPWDGSVGRARLLGAQALAERGEVEAATQLLRPLSGDDRFRELARMEQLRLKGEWTDIVRLVDGQREGTRDLRIAPVYLEALGETQDTSSLLTLFAKLPQGIRRLPGLQLTVLAYAGQEQLVDLLLAQQVASSSQPRALYLRAVAKQSSGDTAGARLLLDSLRERAPWHRQALRRSRHPLAPVSGRLSPSAERALRSIEQMVLWEQAHPPLPPRRPVVTWALITTLIIVFAISARGGSTDAENLVAWGALQLPLRHGHHWRILTAGLLHYGTTHLILNLLGLWLLGRALEQLWGHTSALLAFVVGSAGAYWLATLTVQLEPHETRVLLGASAGVFGLVGALLTFDTVGALFGQVRLLNRRLVVLLLLVAAQLVFDYFTPIVSSLLHLAGAGFGALSALPLSVWHWRGRTAKD